MTCTHKVSRYQDIDTCIVSVAAILKFKITATAKLTTVVGTVLIKFLSPDNMVTCVGVIDRDRDIG